MALRSALAGLIFLSGSDPVMALDAHRTNQHIQIAQTDLKHGDWQRALARFRWLLLEGGPTPQYEAALQNTIQTITRENPLSFSMGATLLPSSNVSNGSSQRLFVTDFGVFQVDSAEDRKSGLGLRLSADATFTQTYARGRSWSLTAFAAANLYGEKELQLGQIGLSLGHEWLSAGQQTRLSFGVNKALYRDLDDRNSPDYRSHALTLSHNKRLSDRAWLGLSASLQDLSYPERAYNDGRHASVYVSPRYRLTPNSTLSLKAGIQSAKIDAEHLSYDGHSLGLFLDRSERNGLNWGIGAEVHWRGFDSRFPGLSVHRKDDVRDLVVSASHGRVKLWGKTPRLRCTIRDHHSNVALYDYDTVDCAVSLNYSF